MWLLLLLCVPCLSISALDDLETSLVPFITKCKLQDNECAAKSTIKAIPIFAEGLPNLNVKPSDPLKIKEVNASKPGLELIVKNIVVTGMKNCEMRDFQRDTEAETITLVVRCKVLAVGDYKMQGKLLFLNIEGEGPMTTKIPGIEIKVDCTYGTIDTKGEKYWKIKTWKYDYDLVGESSVRFENLFPNSEILRKSTEEVIAQNGNAVIREMGTPLITAVVRGVVMNIRDFFLNVPLKYLILE